MDDEMILYDEIDNDAIAAETERKMRGEAIARLVVNIILLANWILTLTGKNPIPFSEEIVYTWLSGIFSSVGLLWGAYWKNNNLTSNACKAQSYKNELDSNNVKYHEEPDMGDWDDEDEEEIIEEEVTEE